MSLVETINEAWGWSGITITRVRAQSPMGHLVVSDADDCFYYLDPDGMAIIALGSREDAQAHLDDEEAKQLWFGGELVASAREVLGEPPEGSVLTLKPHAMLAGEYAPENMCILPLEELIAFSGQIALQLKDLPEGAQFEIKVTD
ncbi:T6SS immunity protein Tdi1 domain-containing protein [Erythrobacter sp. THAF29]|uniref:T6SS immunity protein Tdi1 domain-containing protein n=1 Tax=Erythrobacter sp. THAF29 TaxID=2587851 RepID=UPI001268FE82|nr:T6SS immunity protein Tdi1 domain-containing protein [Erythrobacter sp. THAF29]QFT78816.1 hypothetical protein FIU90_14795 [Erythrobacter sp. THAF29]